MTTRTTTARPITYADVDDVALYLQRSMTSGVTAEQWAAALRSTWQHDAPNHGFHLRSDDDVVVGAYVALYSSRIIDGRPTKVCNLAAWSVDERHRFRGIRLLQALTSQTGYVFTDLSPSGNVIELDRRLGFRDFDVTTSVRPTLPRIGRRIRAVIDPVAIEQMLHGPDRTIFLDHRDAPAVHHVVLVDRESTCYVVYRRVRRKRLPLFATVLYVSDRDAFARVGARFSTHLLRRHAIPFVLLERRIVGRLPRFSYRIRAPRPKMFKSDGTTPAIVDDLYSEMVAVPW